MGTPHLVRTTTPSADQRRTQAKDGVTRPLARRANVGITLLCDPGAPPGDPLVVESRLRSGVGGRPVSRERPADARHGLGIPLDFGRDLMTVVATGAATPAGAQPLPDDWTAPVPEPDAFTPRVPAGQLRPALVVGLMTAATCGMSVEPLNVESDPPWHSGRIALSVRGEFSPAPCAPSPAGATHLHRRPDGRHRDPAAFHLRPAHLHRRRRRDRSHAHPRPGRRPRRHQVRPRVERGARLPVRRTAPLRITLAAGRGASGRLIRIPVL